MGAPEQPVNNTYELMFKTYKFPIINSSKLGVDSTFMSCISTKNVERV